MKSNIKNIYDELYQHWLKEYDKKELTKLELDAFSNYKRALDYLNNFKPEKDDKIKIEFLTSYKENFNFLLMDFLKIREIKLINAALVLKEIELEALL
ncbi:MAG: hypothetical protein EU539_02665, partial [Promethearchaeota archaeon]